MKRIATPAVIALCFAALALSGCRGSQPQDTLISSVSNPDHTYRATIVLREYVTDGQVNTSPTTYVLLERSSGSFDYQPGVEFKDSEVVMKPSQCGPLSVKWTDNSALKITCEKCGIALSAVGPHPQGMGPIKIEYDGFPEMSSWETGPRSR
jgi:hypothetical protein